jgi:hypothetical protein
MKIKKWFFDNYPDRRNPDVPRSWVQISDTDGGRELTVFLKGEKSLTFNGDIDQWGTWIGIMVEKPFTVAQEWSTKSFMQALLAGLTEFSIICDFEGDADAQKPECVEEEISDPGDQHAEA